MTKAQLEELLERVEKAEGPGEIAVLRNFEISYGTTRQDLTALLKAKIAEMEE